LKAVTIHAHGGIDQLCYGETDDPEIRSSTDVIVKLKTAAVNQIDLAIRAGARGAKISSPRILGADGAGTVVAVGAGVKNVRTGDAVCLYPVIGCGRCRSCVTELECRCTARHLLGEHNHGTYGEYIRVPGKNCFAVPAGLSFEEAAAFPLVYVTAWRMLITHANLRPGEWVLIMGAGGGIATAALHLAAAIGAHIIVASSSEAKLARALELGAAHGLNYRKQEFAKEARRLTDKHGVDVVVDCSGGKNWTRCFAALARGGRLATCGAGAGASPKSDLRRVFWNHLKIFGTTAGNRAEFCRLLNFMAVSSRKPVIDQVFPLQDAKWAQQRMQDGRQFGKIVLRVSP
jgi:NADPH:quinone reductase-like Zn-dependent oxidoreductase